MIFVASSRLGSYYLGAGGGGLVALGRCGVCGRTCGV